MQFLPENRLMFGLFGFKIRIRTEFRFSTHP